MNEEYYMNIAYKEALKAYKKKEIPVGAIIVKNNKIISKAHNDRQKRFNILGHAQIKSILKAEKKLKDWRLDDCEMYVTLNPCKMCKMLISESRLKKVIYLSENDKNNKNQEKSNNIIQTNVCILLKMQYEKLLKTFFKEMRK